MFPSRPVEDYWALLKWLVKQFVRASQMGSNCETQLENNMTQNEILVIQGQASMERTRPI